MIVPTVGRIVWIFNRQDSESGDQPEAAMIAYVNDGDAAEDAHFVINVGGLDKHGHPFALSNVPLWGTDPVEGEDQNSLHAEWMPYQKKVAAGEIEPPLHAQVGIEKKPLEASQT